MTRTDRIGNPVRSAVRALAAAAALLAAAPFGAAAAPPARTLEEVLPEAAIRDDFAHLYRRLQAAHFNLYARVGRPSYDRLYRTSAAAITRPESRFEIARRFQL